MGLEKRFNELKDKVATAKAEKAAAEKRKEELVKKLKDKGIDPDDLENEIKKQQKRKDELEKDIEQKLTEAENVFKNQ